MCTSCLAGWAKKPTPGPRDALPQPPNADDLAAAAVFPMMGKKESLRPVGNAAATGIGSEKTSSGRRTSVQNIEKHLSERPDRPVPRPSEKSNTSAAAGRRNSQNAFADKSQTVIILDWDDTLFPSTYIRSDLSFSLRHSLQDQQITAKLREEVRENLAKLAASVDRVLRIAITYGKVIIVTLAKNPWVTNSCKFFFPGIGELIASLGIKIVYAQQGINVEYDKLQMMQDDEIGQFWSRIKGEAISKEIEAFYSQYDGQTWKNIISIGDSDFERLGTMMSVGDYMKNHGITPQNGSPLGEADIHGHYYRVRTKTFKMLDQPTVEELNVQVDLLHNWVPLMVALDDGFDVEFDSLENDNQLKEIEATLQGKP